MVSLTRASSHLLASLAGESPSPVVWGIPSEQRADEIARVVSEARLATLQLEARAALELAKKTLAAVQGNGIDLETLEDIIMAQEYRLNIWPTPKPTEPPEVRQKLTLYFAHEMPADAAKDAIRLTVNHEGKCERSQEPTRR